MTEKAALKSHTKMSSPPSSFRLEAQRGRRGMSLLFCGIVTVEEFSDVSVILKSRGGRILIGGERLDITVFENNSLEITGKVKEIAFRYGKN